MGESGPIDFEGLRTAADYQFGSHAGASLFADPDRLTVTQTRSGRPRQVRAPAGRVVTYGTDGRFRLGITGGRRLASAPSPVGYNVRVGEESVPYIQEGKNAFAKFVHQVDPAIRPGDEVLVTGPDGSLIGVGRAVLAGPSMTDFDRGMAVEIRDGTAERQA